MYWNVNGLGWAFPIEHISAIVMLPQQATGKVSIMEAYTGSRGSKGKDYTVSTNDLGEIVFNSTLPFGPREGMTVVVGWPKGIVYEPTATEKFEQLVSDNRGMIYGLAGLVLLLAYYLVAWAFVGRDPASGPIAPLYEPPDNLSPAAMRFIENMGFDKKTMAAAVLNMAVKGVIRIEEDDGDFTLIKLKDTVDSLSKEEQKLVKKMFRVLDTLELTPSNATKMQKALKAFQLSLATQFEKKFFVRNTGWFVPGILLSLVTFALMVLTADKLPVAMFMTVWLSFWTLGVSALVFSAFSKWKTAFSGMRAADFLGAAFLSLFALPFLAGEGFGIWALASATSLGVVIILLAILLINVLFYHLLKAPTMFGRREMDKIEGFKLFLSVSEKDYLNFRTPVEKTPELFEKYLPYALALNVENRWAEKFADVLRTDLTPDQGGYRPNWYAGTAAWSTLGAAGFTSGFSSSFSSAISSSTTPPGSSSGGGGGGSSGGGGGGGGGGGF